MDPSKNNAAVGASASPAAASGGCPTVHCNVESKLSFKKGCKDDGERSDHYCAFLRSQRSKRDWGRGGMKRGERVTLVISPPCPVTHLSPSLFFQVFSSRLRIGRIGTGEPRPSNTGRRRTSIRQPLQQIPAATAVFRIRGTPNSSSSPKLRIVVNDTSDYTSSVSCNCYSGSGRSSTSMSFCLLLRQTML